jgi:photosystem II stability/assembly factor-like uncharacterized protein
LTPRAPILCLVVAIFLFAGAGATATPPPLAFRWIQMIDYAHGYALTGQDVYDLLWTNDGGHSWSNVTPGKGTIHPSSTLSIFGSTRLFSRKLGPHTFAVVRSNDAGRTWRQSRPFADPHGQGAGQPYAVDPGHLFLAVDEGAAAGSQSQALFTSSDGGEHWTFASRTEWNHPAPGSLPVGCDKNGFAFTTTSRGWAGGDCAGGPPFLYRTIDGGKTWRRQRVAAPINCACNTTTPAFFGPSVGTLAVTGFPASGGGAPIARLFWTHDGGEHWKNSATLSTGRVEQVSVANAHDVWITSTPRGHLRTPFNRLIRTADGGLHWQATNLPFDAGNYRLDALSKRTAFGVEVAAVSNTVVVTHDGGRTWTTIHARLG